VVLGESAETAASPAGWSPGTSGVGVGRGETAACPLITQRLWTFVVRVSRSTPQNTCGARAVPDTCPSRMLGRIACGSIAGRRRYRAREASPLKRAAALSVRLPTGIPVRGQVARAIARHRCSLQTAAYQDHRQRIVSRSDATSPHGLIHTGMSSQFSGRQRHSLASGRTANQRSHIRGHRSRSGSLGPPADLAPGWPRAGHESGGSPGTGYPLPYPILRRANTPRVPLGAGMK
jgi:hypothetical protein